MRVCTPTCLQAMATAQEKPRHLGSYSRVDPPRKQKSDQTATRTNKNNVPRKRATPVVCQIR